MKNNLRRNAERGFSLIELTIYIMMATLIFLAIATSIQYVYRFYRELTIGPRADRVAASVIERVVRDVRTGSTIVLAESTFGVPTGAITISARDGGVEVEKRVAVGGGRITYTENDGTPLELTPADITVSRLSLTYLTSPVSEAVRIELELTYEMQGSARTKTYTGFAILRHSYE